MQESKSKTTRKTRRGKIMVWIIPGILLLFLLYAVVQGIRTSHGLSKAHKRLSNYDVKTATLSYGDVTYLDEGSCEIILSVHGIFGGYDQA